MAEPSPRTDDSDGATSAVPFVVAAVGFVIVAVLAFVYLREDDELEILRPDAIEAIDDRTVRAVVDDVPTCDVVERAQVDLSDNETVFVELVVRPGTDCSRSTGPVVAEITVPRPIDGRRIAPGVGRVEIACTGEASNVSCEGSR